MTFADMYAANEWLEIRKNEAGGKNEAKLQVFLKTLCPYLSRKFCDSKALTQDEVRILLGYIRAGSSEASSQMTKITGHKNSLRLILPNL